MEFFQVLIRVCDFSAVLICIGVFWKRRDLLKEGVKNQILWNRFFVSGYSVFALRSICLAVLAPPNESRFTNSIWAILSMIAVWGWLKENNRSKKLLEVKDSLVAESNPNDHIY
jgi:hypothetical protein